MKITFTMKLKYGQMATVETDEGSIEETIKQINLIRAELANRPLVLENPIAITGTLNVKSG